MNQDLSLTANLLGDPGRAAILLSLMDGLALPAGELASIANVAPQTASGHLARLIDGGLLSVERQGRHSTIACRARRLRMRLRRCWG